MGGAAAPEGACLSIWVALVPAVLASFCDYFGLGVIGPLLPYWVRDNGAAEVMVGAIQTAQYAGVLLGSFVLGRVADARGRKTAMVVALLGDVLTFTSSGFMPTAASLLVVRFFAGFFTPLVPSIAWITDAANGDAVVRTKYMAVWGLSMSTAFMVGSALGGALGVGGWVVGHVTSGALALVGLVYAASVAPPPRPNAAARPSGIGAVMRSLEFTWLAACNVIVGIQFTGGLVMISLLIVFRLGVSADVLAIVFVVMALVHVGINFLGVPVSVRLYGSPMPAMSISLAVAMAAHVAFLFEGIVDSSTPLACALMILSSACLPVFMTGANYVAPNYADRYSKNARGSIIGIARLFFNVGQMLGPIVAAALYAVDFRLYFAAVLIAYVATFVPWRHFHMKAEAAERAPPAGEEGDAELALAKAGAAADAKA